MYRDYENPRDLEDKLNTCRDAIRGIENNIEPFNEMTEDEKIDLLIELKDDESWLEQRLNFAWQDEEADDDF